MDKTTEERLLDSFAEAAGSGGGESSEDLAGLSANWTIESGAAPHAPGTEAVSASKTGGSGVSAGSVAKTVLESGLGLIPLIDGLIGLFDGGSSSAPELTKYVMPPSLDFAAADTGGELSGVSYDQMGTPRTASQTAAAAPAQATAPQAVNSQWFMDHSADIAAAVRNAMLNSNSINDVVSEL